METHNWSEAGKVRKALNNPDDVKDLVKAVRRRLYGRVPEHEIDDIVQESLEIARQKAEKFDPAQSRATSWRNALKAWLREIAFNILRERWRKDKRRRELLKDNLHRDGLSRYRLPPSGNKPGKRVQSRRADPHELVDGQAQTADERLARKERATILRGLVDRLRRKSREIIVRRYYREPPQAFKDIAEELRISGSNARQIHHRALDELRRMVGESQLSNEEGPLVTSNQDYRLYLSLKYLDAIDAADYELIAAIWREADKDPVLEEALLALDEEIEHHIL
jgi:RNA polymerase sigma factor (sigma-70 family)